LPLVGARALDYPERHPGPGGRRDAPGARHPRLEGWPPNGPPEVAA